MRIEFALDTNPGIDGLLQIAGAHMVSHLSGRTLYVPVFELEESDDADENNVEDESAVDLEGPIVRTAFDPIPRAEPPPILAVDSGVKNLGRLRGGGIALAVRAAAVLYPPNTRPLVLRYNTGSFVVDAGNRVPIFHYIGGRLGREDLLVHVDGGRAEATDKTPMHANEVMNTCRSFVERMVTEEAIAVLAATGGGILLLDGALPPGSFDVPYSYIRNMLDACVPIGIDVVAISKRTRHTVNGVPIGALFDDNPLFVGYALIRNAVDSMRAAAARASQYRSITAAAEVYAARFQFGPFAPTFRVDVHNSCYGSPNEVITRVYTDTELLGGYPTALIQAHQFSSFLGLDAANLVADLAARYGLRIEPEQTMEVHFQPFNALGK